MLAESDREQQRRQVKAYIRECCVASCVGGCLFNTCVLHILQEKHSTF